MTIATVACFVILTAASGSPGYNNTNLIGGFFLQDGSQIIVNTSDVKSMVGYPNGTLLVTIDRGSDFFVKEPLQKVYDLFSTCGK